jgi:hypothetical protein
MPILYKQNSRRERERETEKNNNCLIFLLQGESRLKYQQVVKRKFEQSEVMWTGPRLKTD